VAKSKNRNKEIFLWSLASSLLSFAGLHVPDPIRGIYWAAGLAFGLVALWTFSKGKRLLVSVASTAAYGIGVWLALADCLPWGIFWNVTWGAVAGAALLALALRFIWKLKWRFFWIFVATGIVTGMIFSFLIERHENNEILERGQSWLAYFIWQYASLWVISRHSKGARRGR
jgi:hypothetical protein